jgi:hypothetical protein
MHFALAPYSNVETILYTESSRFFICHPQMNPEIQCKSLVTILGLSWFGASIKRSLANRHEMCIGGSLRAAPALLPR